MPKLVLLIISFCTISIINQYDFANENLKNIKLQYTFPKYFDISFFLFFLQFQKGLRNSYTDKTFNERTGSLTKLRNTF